jgi:tetratricopeptide (TPR) repeat protein
MRKVIITLILILIVVYAGLSILNWRGEYSAERIFYRAIKANEKVLINPDVAPPGLLAYVEKNLQTLLKKYPHTKTVKGARLALAEFYLNRKRYDEAQAVLDKIIGIEKEDLSMLSKAHFVKGVIYEKRDEWDKALEEYETLKDELTETALGLQIPLYIGSHYAERGDQKNAARSYNEAATFYKKLAEENKGKLLGYTASTVLRHTLIILERYEEAGRVLEDTLETYPTEQTFAQQLTFVELIFVSKLNRPEKAIELYKYVQSKTNYDKLKEFLEEKIKQLEAETP